MTAIQFMLWHKSALAFQLSMHITVHHAPYLMALQHFVDKTRARVHTPDEYATQLKYVYVQMQQL